MRIKINFILIIIFQLFNFLGFSQEKGITDYKNDKYSKLNLSLNGQVKYLKEVTDNLFIGNNEEIEYFFDKKGLPIKIVESSLGLDVMARELRNENSIFSFENGKLISELNQIDKGLDGYTYELNDYGNVLHEKYYVENRLVSEKLFEYDSQNRLVKSTDYVYGYFRDYVGERPENKEDFISMIKTFTYDKMGNLIEDSMNNIKGNVFKKHLYKYDKNGNLIQEGWCKSYKGLSDQNKCNYQPSTGYEYNKKNEMVKKFAIGNWSPHKTDTYYNYDNQGRKTESKGYYINKDTILGYHFNYVYDSLGNKVKDEEVFGKYRRLGFERYKTERNEFDEFQNIILVEYITKDDERIKVIKFEYSYDAYGNWIERQKLEGKTSADLELIEMKQRKIEYYN